MINPTDADIGRRVLYINYATKDRLLAGKDYTPTVGVITSMNEHYVFVRYSKSSTSQATARRDLEWEHETKS